MQPVDGTALDDLPDLPIGIVNSLKASWITTAEQLVAATAATGGPGVMAGHLGVEETEFRRVLDAAETAIPAAERRRLKTPADTRNFGLGGPLREPPG